MTRPEDGLTFGGTRPQVKPLAITLYERHRMGQPVESLSRDLEIPVARVEQRIRAAAKYVSTHRRMPEWG